MPTKNGNSDAPPKRPKDAAKKPGGAAKAKSQAREDRLAQALRDNLRRRKTPKADVSKKEE